MKEIAWLEFGKGDRIVSRRKSFKDDAAMERFVKKLVEKDNFYRILARGE